MTANETWSIQWTRSDKPTEREEENERKTRGEKKVSRTNISFSPLSLEQIDCNEQQIEFPPGNGR